MVAGCLVYVLCTIFNLRTKIKLLVLVLCAFYLTTNMQKTNFGDYKRRCLWCIRLTFFPLFLRHRSAIQMIPRVPPLSYPVQLWGNFLMFRSIIRKLKYLLKIVFFRENAFILPKGIFSKVRERKICRWWPSVLLIDPGDSLCLSTPHFLQKLSLLQTSKNPYSSGNASNKGTQFSLSGQWVRHIFTFITVSDRFPHFTEK